MMTTKPNDSGKRPMTNEEIRAIIRQMLADWNRLTPAQQAQAMERAEKERAIMTTSSRKTDHKSSAMREFDLGRGLLSVHRRPVDAGQIVDVRYGRTESYIVRIEHDRSDDTVVVEAYLQSVTGVYEPWNDRVDLGRRVGVIFYGSRAELAL